MKRSVLKQLIKEIILKEKKDYGLYVTPSTKNDSIKLAKWIDNSDYYAEYSSDGYWFFPEKKDTYDALEKELNNLLNKKGISVSFEGVF